RPPTMRALDLALGASTDDDGVGLELSLGTQAADRMVGEPTTYTKAWFDAWPTASDATPLLNEARAIKTPQELERMRIANEIAAAAMEHVKANLRPVMTEIQQAALWLGHFHVEGTALPVVDLALGFYLVWSGPGFRTFTGSGDPAADSVHGRRQSPPYSHQAGDGTIEMGMVTASEPGIYWPAAGGLRVEDHSSVTSYGAENLSSFPNDFRSATPCGPARSTAT